MNKRSFGGIVATCLLDDANSLVPLEWGVVVVQTQADPLDTREPFKVAWGADNDSAEAKSQILNTLGCLIDVLTDCTDVYGTKHADTRWGPVFPFAHWLDVTERGERRAVALGTSLREADVFDTRELNVVTWTDFGNDASDRQWCLNTFGAVLDGLEDTDDIWPPSVLTNSAPARDVQSSSSFVSR